MQEISYEYIRGLIDGEGCFTFCTIPGSLKVGDKVSKPRIPAFILSMNSRDKDLIASIRNRLGLRNRIYTYRSTPLHTFNKSYIRGSKSILIVRDFPSLKNVIVPLFYEKLRGYKGTQFGAWLGLIGTDPAVPSRYKLIYRLHKSGFYNQNNRFNG